MPNNICIMEGFFFFNVGGRGVQDEGHMYTHGWFMSMYGKKHYNIVK